MLLSSGGTNIGSSGFVGVGAADGVEVNVQQIMSVSGTFTSMRCFITVAPGVTNGALVFTLRIGGANTPLTCIIPVGMTSGVSVTGLSTPFVAGNVVDVAAQAATGMGNPLNHPGSFAVTIGP
jgi:hypothetical protein